MAAVFGNSSDSCLLEDLNPMCCFPSIDEFVTSNNEHNFSSTSFINNRLDNFFHNEDTTSLYLYGSTLDRSSAAISSLISFYGSDTEAISNSGGTESKTLNRVLVANSSNPLQYMNKNNIIKNKLQKSNNTVVFPTAEQLSLSNPPDKKKTKNKQPSEGPSLLTYYDFSNTFQIDEKQHAFSGSPFASYEDKYSENKQRQRNQQELHDLKFNLNNQLSNPSSPVLLVLKDSLIQEDYLITQPHEENRKSKFSSVNLDVEPQSKKKNVTPTPDCVQTDVEYNRFRLPDFRQQINNTPMNKRYKKFSSKLQNENIDNSVITPAFMSKSELVAYVEQKLESMEESFTFKSATYQLHLKKFLPKPDDKHRKYIEKIQCFPRIPISNVEKRELLSLRQVKQGMNPESRLGDGDGLTIKERLDEMLTSLVNKIMFLLVVQFGTWYIHAPAREQIREQLLEFIWPSLPQLQASFREHFTSFIDMRIRHFRDSVARYFRDRPRVDTKLSQGNNKPTAGRGFNQFRSSPRLYSPVSCLLPKLPPSYEITEERIPSSNNGYTGGMYQNYVTSPPSNVKIQENHAMSNPLPTACLKHYANHPDLYISQERKSPPHPAAATHTSASSEVQTTQPNEFYTSQRQQQQKQMLNCPKYLMQRAETPTAAGAFSNFMFFPQGENVHTPTTQRRGSFVPSNEETASNKNTQESKSGSSVTTDWCLSQSFVTNSKNPEIMSNNNSCRNTNFEKQYPVVDVSSLKQEESKINKDALVSCLAKSSFSSILPEITPTATKRNSSSIPGQSSIVPLSSESPVEPVMKTLQTTKYFENKLLLDAQSTDATVGTNDSNYCVSKASEKDLFSTNNFLKSQGPSNVSSSPEILVTKQTGTKANQNIDSGDYFPRNQLKSSKTPNKKSKLTNPCSKLMMPCTIKSSPTSSSSFSVSSDSKVVSLLPMTEAAAAAYTSHRHIRKIIPTAAAHGLSTLAIATETLLSSSCVRSTPYSSFISERMCASLCL